MRAHRLSQHQVGPPKGHRLRSQGPGPGTDRGRSTRFGLPGLRAWVILAACLLGAQGARAVELIPMLGLGRPTSAGYEPDAYAAVSIGDELVEALNLSLHGQLHLHLPRVANGTGGLQLDLDLVPVWRPLRGDRHRFQPLLAPVLGLVSQRVEVVQSGEPVEYYGRGLHYGIMGGLLWRVHPDVQLGPMVRYVRNNFLTACEQRGTGVYCGDAEQARREGFFSVSLAVALDL